MVCVRVLSWILCFFVLLDGLFWFRCHISDCVKLKRSEPAEHSMVDETCRDPNIDGRGKEFP